MPAPNLGNLIVALGLVLALPLLLGAVATLAAGLEGAEAGPRLPAGRRLIAAGAGGLAGGLALAAAAAAGLSAAAGLPGCFLAVFAASGSGMLTAYHAARVTAARLDRYRCGECRARFRSAWPAGLCPRCAGERELAGSRRAAAG